MDLYHKRWQDIRWLVLLLISVCIIFAPSVVVHGLIREDTRQRGRITGDDNQAPDRFVSLRADKLMERSDGAKAFFERYGKDVKIIGRADSDGIYRIFGGDIKMDIPRRLAVESGAAIVDACKGFINQNKELFGISTDEIKPLRYTHRGGIWFMDFGQIYKGIPVYGSKISFIVSENGDVMSITMNHFPGVVLPEIQERKASESEEAIAAAISDLAAIYPGAHFDASAGLLFVYPFEDKGSARFVWAWLIELRCRDPLQKWLYIIEADTSTILDRKVLGRHLISGQAKGQVLPRYSNDNPVDAALPKLKVICLRDDSPLMYNSLDTDPGWLGTTPYGWEFGQPVYPVSSAGGPGPDKGHTGLTFYAYNLNGYYPLNMWSPQYLTTSNPVNCTSGKNVYLRFWRWLGIENSKSDHASIEISDGPTSTWWKIWENPEEDIYDGGWRLVLYDISKWAEGRENIFFRWGIGPTNGYVSYCGWNIDDIGVYSSVFGITDHEGCYQITGEAQKNILCSCLEGSYFKVINEDGADAVYTKSNVASGATGEAINFKRITDYDVSTKTGTVNSLSNIDEINVYYHANLLVRHIQEIDPEFWAETSDAFPIRITVRYQKEYMNSFWMPGEGIFFGEGDKYEYSNFAHFSDIIYHECAHAVTDSIYGQLEGLGKGIGDAGGYAALSRFTEFDAMHEAFSDYWACTINNDPQIAEGGFWIGHDYVRTLENGLNYLTNYGQELYQSSQILSGAMWDLRQALRQEVGDEGIRVADTLFYFAALAQPATYLDFLIDCLIIDQVRYGSIHGELIKEIFGQRGISQAPAPPSSLVVNIQNQIASLVWSGSPDAKGYYLYYGPNTSSKTTWSLSEDQDERSAFYMQDGGSSSSEEKEEGGGMSGSGGGSSSSQNTSSQTSSNTGSSTSSGTSSNTGSIVTSSKLDVGNTNSYYLTGLDPAITYKVQVTAYNIYGVESSPSEEAIITGSGSIPIPGSGSQTGGTETGTTGTGWDSEAGEAGFTQGVTCFISACEH
ncbi:hypothetical protein JXL19_05675 [bacterium]|nr:hypothetical protein [bacterium]